MHVLVVALGSAGDMHPFLRVARELQARGLRVTVLGPAAHAAMARADALPYVGFGTPGEYDAVLADPLLWHPLKGFGVVWRGIADNLRLLPDFIATLPPREPLALFAHPLALPAADLARAARPGLRIVAAWLAPANLRSIAHPLTLGPWRVPAWVPAPARRGLWRAVEAWAVDPVALPGLNAARHAAGLPPVAHLLAHLESVADAHLTLFPPWFAPTAADWPRPLQAGTFPLHEPGPPAAMPPALHRFLADGPRPLVFTPGSGNRQAARWFARALEATRRLGARAIFLTPARDQVPDHLPPEVLWLPYLPLRDLLPGAAALIHHGGIGTCAEGLRAGVPQVVIPMAYDQFDNGARLERLGVGRAVRGWRARPGALASTLRGLLASAAVAEACAAAATRIRADASQDIGATVESLIRGIREMLGESHAL